MMTFPSVELRLPSWISDVVSEKPLYPDEKSRMDLVVSLARNNVERGTGGPFGAAIFDRETGRLVAPGVNLVTTANFSVAHAEIVAVMIAQRVEGTFDLGSEGRDYELFTSTEPCAMCLGAVPWSGVRHLVCAARDEDARAVGFDEGAKVEDWEESLSSRGISVRRDVGRADASEVLREYAERGGKIYNSREE